MCIRKSHLSPPCPTCGRSYVLRKNKNGCPNCIQSDEAQNAREEREEAEKEAKEKKIKAKKDAKEPEKKIRVKPRWSEKSDDSQIVDENQMVNMADMADI